MILTRNGAAFYENKRTVCSVLPAKNEIVKKMSQAVINV